MANHPSALKRHLQSLKRNALNRAFRSRLSSIVKKARQSIVSKEAMPNDGDVKKAVSFLAKAGQKGIIHKKAAQRRISRIMKQAAAK